MRAQDQSSRLGPHQWTAQNALRVGEILDYMLVVNDLVKHVHGRSVSLKSSFHSLDSHLNACTVAARLCYNDFAYCHKYASSLVD